MNTEELAAMLKAPAVVGRLTGTQNVAAISEIVSNLSEQEAKAALMMLAHQVAGATGAADPSIPLPQRSDMLKIDEAADILRVGRNKMYGLVRCGKVKSILNGRNMLIPRHCLDQYIREQIAR